MVNEILNFILVHTRSIFLLNLSKLFPPRVYLSRFSSFIWKTQLIPRHPVNKYL